MDMRYLDKLEREFTQRHDQPQADPRGPSYTDEFQQALKRGREYHAIALNLALHHVMTSLKKLIRRMAGGRHSEYRDSHRPLTEHHAELD